MSWQPAAVLAAAVAWDGHLCVARPGPDGTSTVGIVDHVSTAFPGDVQAMTATQAGRFLVASTCGVLAPAPWGASANLYRIDARGQWRRLTRDPGGNRDPHAMDDGRIMYIRREFIDQGQGRCTVFTMNEDGTNQTLFYDPRADPRQIIQARPVPGAEAAIAVAARDQAADSGSLVRIDAMAGRRDGYGLMVLSETGAWRDPWPLPDGRIVAAWRGDPAGRWKVVVRQADGAVTDLIVDAERDVLQPRPLLSRAVGGIRPDAVDLRTPEAFIYIQDVYAGLGMIGVPRGSAASLRVLALDLPVDGHAVGAASGQPTKTIIGTVPLAADGSAFVRVPPAVPLTFQILDRDGAMIQTMRSWISLQRGERRSCVGCHDQPNLGPLTTTPTAFRQAPADCNVRSLPVGFRTQVQPILDRQCASCHGLPRPSPRASFVSVADANGPWTDAWRTLTADRMAGATPDGAMPLPPSRFASATSHLLALVDGHHHGVHLDAAERAALAAWIDRGMPMGAAPADVLAGDALAAHRARLAQREAAMAAERAAMQAEIIATYGNE